MSRRPRVRYATIYVFPNGRKGVTVNAAPERLTVRPGDIIDWTVVNAAGVDGKIGVRWKKDSPLKREPEPFPRMSRAAVGSRVKDGIYKYSITLNGEVVFDPEVEIVQ
jgi:hypothetical protein